MAAKLISATRALTLATAFAVALVPAAPALAWGDREQGVVTGIAGTLLLQGILRDLERQNRPRPAIIRARRSGAPRLPRRSRATRAPSARRSSAS